MAEMDDEMDRLWGPVSHLNSVCDSETLRPVYQQGVQALSAWHSEQAQNEALYQAIAALETSQTSLNQEQRAWLEQTIRDFKLAGVALPEADKQRFTTILMRLSDLGTRFEQHVLDATRAFELHLDDTADLAGLPESVIQAAAQRAQESQREGWLFTLDIPSYLPFMQHAANRDLRQRMYTAYTSRASEGELNNTPVIEETLALRLEMAQMLGFINFAEYSLATKMADTPAMVESFLRELAEKSHSLAEQEMTQLRQFAQQVLVLEPLQAWDIPFASEKLRQQLHAISDEELKPYFPESRVIPGMYALVEKLYGIRIREQEAPRWHADARYFGVFDQSDSQIAGFYLDPYARAHKRGGAWMDECRTRWRQADGGLNIPVAYLVCNFDAPVGNKPALWTHDEVMTLFHEFGHGLHHMLTRVEQRGVSGIHGVPWDAVELPSQFMENFCWERSTLDLISGHWQSGEPLPDELFERMVAAKNFQTGMHMLRQLEFSLFDLLLHVQTPAPDGEQVQALLDALRRDIAVVIPPAFNRFQNGFSHIFAGGYAAGYFSYKWAEVLSADAYAAFEEEGLMNPETAKRFLDCILSIGGSRDILQAFTEFRGRKPNVDALLKHSGIVQE